MASFWEGELTELKFEELPEIPPIWIDYIVGLDSLRSLLADPCDMQSLVARVDESRNRARRTKSLVQFLAGVGKMSSARTQENIQRLQQPESSVIITSVDVSLFGGVVSQLLKCLTAIKICEELAKHAVTAIPVCWMNPTLPRGLSNWSANLLDSQAELHELHIRQSGPAGFSPSDPLPSDQISMLLERIEDLGSGTFDPETLDILKAAYSVEATFSSSSAHLLSALMEEWGMVVLDPQSPGLASIVSEALAPLRDHAGRIDARLQVRERELADAGYTGEFVEHTLAIHLVRSSVLPVIASVLDPYELYSFVRILPAYDELGLVKPIAWPKSSSTILDTRSRRTLEKYHLSFNDLFKGEEEILNKINDAMPCSVPGKLDSLKVEVERQMAELNPMVLTGDDFAKTRDSCMERVVYQIERLRDRVEAAQTMKKEILRRQIRRLCNSLAPNGKIQEYELAGIYFLLRYSRTLLQFLYKNLDIMKFEHQLISMD